jgi:hypothetical protein
VTVFSVSAKTGDGMEAFCGYLAAKAGMAG